MGLGKTLASLGAAAAFSLTPAVSQAENGQSGEAKSVHHAKESHHNHLIFGVEGAAHVSYIRAGVFHELGMGGHLSLGIEGGLGLDYQSPPSSSPVPRNLSAAASLDVLAAYHKTIKDKIFGVVEAGVGVELVKGSHGIHAAPVAKATGLVGYQLTDSLGVYIGPGVIRSPSATDVSVSVGAVFGI